MHAGYPTFVPLGWLVISAMVGNVLALAASIVFDPFCNLEDPGILRSIQAVSEICTFLVPAFLVAFLCSKEPGDYLFIKRFPGIKTALLTFVSVLLLSPAITLTGFLNKSIFDSGIIRLPPFLELIEEEAERLTAIFLSDTSLEAILLNLFVIAIIAAVTEEFFFRGALQRIVERWFKSHHVVIWSIAFIFSVVHMQFLGLIPRMLLGAYFGYLLYWSKNIWIPILAHFCNNAVAVIGMSNGNLKENVYISGEIQEWEISSFAIVTTISCIFFYFCANSLRKRLQRA